MSYDRAFHSERSQGGFAAPYGILLIETELGTAAARNYVQKNGAAFGTGNIAGTGLVRQPDPGAVKGANTDFCDVQAFDFARPVFRLETYPLWNKNLRAGRCPAREKYRQ